MKFSLDTRDFVNIGVFAVLYIILFFGTGMLGIFAPWMMFVGWIIGILLGGIVVVFLMSRTQKMWVLTILGVFTALIMTLSGHTYWMLLCAPALGFIADGIATNWGAARRLTTGRGIAAYTVFTLWFMVPLIPFVTASDADFQQIANEMSPHYAEQMRALFQPWILLLWCVCIVVLGTAGGWLGTRMAHKHFNRAGLTR